LLLQDKIGTHTHTHTHTHKDFLQIPFCKREILRRLLTLIIGVPSFLLVLAIAEEFREDGLTSSPKTKI
jgi:hypothetical protein